ncbi:MAG: Polar amino acid ABC transporter, inner membrane subunit [uncultured bacterium]|nr:MAG: Polar amino acid ABC transporter, inner membrane subunit [uncultured bacterium]HBH18853.1 amino acid ABC transporter permease [Cyanobacteria bacterium UBA9579]
MHWNDILDNFDFLMNGLVVTLQVAGISISGSLILGIILGVIRYSKIFPLNIISVIYIETIRSTPLILFIVFIHFGLLPVIFGESTSVFQSTYIALIIFTSAYVAEITRGGLKSIESGYIEASKSLGLTYFQRLFYVILPLAITRMTPALVSQFISLIKDTSLASAIGLIELTRSGEIIYERTYHEFEILIFIALTYFAICFGLSTLSKKLETKPYSITEFEKVSQN